MASKGVIGKGYLPPPIFLVINIHLESIMNRTQNGPSVLQYYLVPRHQDTRYLRLSRLNSFLSLARADRDIVPCDSVY